MRYPKDHKDVSRHSLLRHTGSHAKRHGFDSSGVAALAASAGVTTGALYKHFSGKADLFSALISAELERTAQMYEGFDPEDEPRATRALADYLSLAHVQHPEQGCPLPSLCPEISRADRSAMSAYQEGLRQIHQRLIGLTGSSAAAWTLIAQNVGAVMLARAMPDEACQREILSSLRQSGELLIAGCRTNRDR
jgi:TetR/AcrR family transcriptional repressor of nem operon